MKNKILIVENDKSLSTSLQKYLQSKDYSCTTASSVSESVDLLESQAFDLVIIDRVLDDGDGLDIIEFLSDFSFQTKILVLSDLKTETNRITGLEAGADDYITKPFSLIELGIKVKKLLQTHKLKENELLTIGDITANPQTGEVFLKGKRKIFRKKELELLICLLRYKNQVVSRDKIIDSVWSNTYDIPTYSTLDVYVRRIRIALGEYKKYIKTVRGFGYMLTQPA